MLRKNAINLFLNPTYDGAFELSVVFRSVAKQRRMARTENSEATDGTLR